MKITKLLSVVSLCLVASMAQAGVAIQHWVAPSVARVFFVENHDLPLLDVQVDFAAGTAHDPLGKAGTASLTQAVIDLGADGMDETAISNRLADLGALLSGGVDMDRASVSLRTLSAKDKREPALDILRAVLTRPQFPADVFEREKARTVAALKDALTRPEAIASKNFWAALYPGHAYGRYAEPEKVSELRRDDLVAFYRNHFVATRATVSIVGDVTRAQAEALAQQLTADLVAAGRGKAHCPSVGASASSARITGTQAGGSGFLCTARGQLLAGRRRFCIAPDERSPRQAGPGLQRA